MPATRHARLRPSQTHRLVLGRPSKATRHVCGFDLANGEGSQILDANGNLLATVTTQKGLPALAFSSGQSLKALYDAGLRIFYYKFESIKGEMTIHGIKLIKDDKGEVKLEP